MNILILDIETAPNKGYFWGLWGQNININQIEEPGYTLCWSAKWYGKRGIMFDSLYHSSQAEMIENIWMLLDEADAVIHYNGTKFDIPTLNAEFAQLGYRPPSPYHQIDLYKTVKKRFRLPSNKLDFVARHFGIQGKVQHKGLSLWYGCMSQDPKSWKTMERYNRQDVRMLEPLYEILLPWIQNHPNRGLFTKDLSRPVCTNCGSNHVVKKGIETTIAYKYQRYSCKDCGTPMRGRFTLSSREESKNILTQSKI